MKMISSKKKQADRLDCFGLESEMITFFNVHFGKKTRAKQKNCLRFEPMNT